MELKKLTPAKKAEKEVLLHLRAKGYTIMDWDRDNKYPSDIEAEKGSSHLLVEVHSARVPVSVVPLLASERAALKTRAQRRSAQPVFVQISLDENNRLASIEYEMM